MNDNPLLSPTLDVPFDRITAAHVKPAIEQLLAEADAAVEAIANGEGAPTYANTLDALERATARLEFATDVVGHLEAVATSASLREAYNAVQPKITSFYTKLPLHGGLYARLCEFSRTDEAAALSPTRARYLEKTLADYRRHGADLDPVQKTRLSEIDVALSELTTRFSQNVLDSTNAFELVITDERRLAGLPESAKAAARQSAEARKVEGFRFTLQAPSLIPVLTYLDDRSIREKVWRAYNRRATSEDFDNRPLILQILALRKEKALLLGYRDFADLVLEDRMAHDGAHARKFVEELCDETRSAFERENRELEEFRSAHGGEGPLKPWDVGYWAEKRRQALFDFDEEQLRPYFPSDRVLDGLFRTVERLYGLTIEPRTDAPCWDESVRSFRVVDQSGVHVGSFYADLFPRESKRGGAWMQSLMDATPPDPHLGVFCANVTPPIGDEPALLTHSEVETLFHEFGHLMHQQLSRVEVRSLAGTNVAWDFVELPSQIMENWCWEREALDLFARHYETDETIPEDLFAKMTRARTYRAANAQMRQLGFAAVDLALHILYDPGSDGDVMAYARNILQQHSPAPVPDDYAMIAGFAHLFGSPVGYGAGYYSYKWAEVLDADAFTRFREEGIFSREVGVAFRTTILAAGDSKDPMELYKEFMGREPRLAPLLERNGLAERRES